MVIYCLVKKEKLSANANAMLFSTGIAPLITELMVRYPNAEAVGFNVPGVLLALADGFVIGFFLPAGLAMSPKIHKGFDLYSAALPIGMTAFFLQAVLYKTMGVALPSAPDAATLQVASRLTVNVFCCVFFGLCVVFALVLGCRPKDYWRLLTDPALVTNFSSAYGNAVFLMNVGVYGLFILGYYNLIGGTFNGVTFGIVFCMLCTCNSGSHPGNVWPIMLGYVVASAGLAGCPRAGEPLPVRSMLRHHGRPVICQWPQPIATVRLAVRLPGGDDALLCWSPRAEASRRLLPVQRRLTAALIASFWFPSWRSLQDQGKRRLLETSK